MIRCRSAAGFNSQTDLSERGLLFTLERNKQHQPLAKSTPEHLHEYLIKGFNMSDFSNSLILKHSSELVSGDTGDLMVLEIAVNSGVFSGHQAQSVFPPVTVRLDNTGLLLTCGCRNTGLRMCAHQSRVMYGLLQREDIRIFFDEELRLAKIRKAAAEYGLENDPHPEHHFVLEQQGRTYGVRPVDKSLVPLTKSAFKAFRDQFKAVENTPPTVPGDTKQRIVVFRTHKYYDHFTLEMYEAGMTAGGKVKAPLVPVQPLGLVWATDKPEELKFYSSIAGFQHNFEKTVSEEQLPGLRHLVRNPLKLPVYYHHADVSDQVNVQSLVPVKLRHFPSDLRLRVEQKGEFYHISAFITLDEQSYELKDIHLRFDYFVMLKDILYLVDNMHIIRIIGFFRQRNNKLLVHASGFEEFRKEVLAGMEDQVKISYTYLREATTEQKEEAGFDQAATPLIYLSDSEDFILITPVMRYGPVEVPVLSKRQIYALDHEGEPFTMPRDEAAEIRFTALLLRQHADFKEQTHNEFFYLHRHRFLEEGWFLQAFEVWRAEGIQIHGFKELKKNRYNPYKASVSVSVSTGINWFDTTLNVRFGNQQVSLKHLYRAIRNHTKFISLDDGTTGILPEEWLTKMQRYFEAGELHGERIRTPRTGFQSLREIYEEEMLETPVKEDLRRYEDSFSGFEAIRETDVPEELNASLRHYQRHGLNWLNFLDDFGFGGCLADDMGLGKTLQVIAFLLGQRKKQVHRTSLVVVPTSLIFNWQEEISRFAPSMKVFTYYGSGRTKDLAVFNEHEVILTSYGTMLSDISVLKQYVFNYVILDESQAIKNPDSQRYKAACLLKSRNRLVMTGTPLENNTYDIYGQLSFACPGLLGSKFRFKTQFAMPVDVFKEEKRARALRDRIRPFILRRTKQQVEAELPEKTEMILYCEMGEEQRKIYNAYEKEFRTFINTRGEGDIPRERLHILQGLTKLRQICNAPALLSDEEFYGDSSAKIDVLMEEITSRSARHKILVFSQFVSMLDLIRTALEKKGVPFSYLSGQTRDRAAAVRRFTDDPAVRVFLVSLKAGGTGLNLTEADYVYLVDPWWNPAVEDQAIDRAYRIGQKKNVVAVRMICPGTIEEKVMVLQSSKKALSADLIRTDEEMLKNLSKADLLKLLD